MSIGIYFGSTTGSTQAVAMMLAKAFNGEEVVVKNISDAEPDEMSGYDLLVLGSSTWGYGELQDDWASFIGRLDGVDLKGKKVALFGVGDQSSWGDTFVDAMGIIYEKVEALGADVAGAWSTAGYEYTESRAEVGDKFVGLAIDEINQSELTGARVDEWVAIVK